MSIEELAQALAYVDPPLPFVSSETAVYFIRVLDQLLAESHLQGKLILPNLREHFERISVYSDYGGEHKDAQYNTYAFLIVGHDLSGHALKKMQDVRREYGLCDPYKEIEYKELRYGPLGRAVPDLLNAADGLPGLLLVLVVDKRLTTILGADSEETLRLAQSTLQGVGVSVKDKVAEKLLRVLHCVAYLCSLLGREGQELFWMTDEDAIAANDELHRALARQVQPLVQNYAGWQFNRFMYSRSLERTEEDVDFNDCLGVVDLAAGSVEEFFTRRSRSEPSEPLVKQATDQVLRWLARQGPILKKCIVRLTTDGDGSMLAQEVRFEMKEKIPDPVLVPVRTTSPLGSAPPSEEDVT